MPQVAIQSGDTTQLVQFTTFAGTTSFTVRRKRGPNASAAMTITAGDIVEDVNQPGAFAMKADEDMTITPGKQSELMRFYIQPLGQPLEIVDVELRGSSNADVLAVLGTPAGASIAADIAAAMTRIGAPAGASIAADIAAIFSRVGAPVLASISADIASILTRLGAPAGASTSADIAAIATSVANVFSRLGAPAGASTAADIAAIFARLGAPAGASTAADIAAAATAIANVFARIGAPTGASVSADVAQLNTKIGTPAVTVSADIAAITGALAADASAIIAAIAALNNVSVAQVRAQVVAALSADTYSEPSGVPPATASLAIKLGYLFAAIRDGIQIDGSFKTFLDQSGSPLWKKALTDGGGTYVEGTAQGP